ncbi:hypothetical protein EIP91_006240 [Steccherinum ochraceum]|uniref:NAD-dependent epimerase/dehydratase domain-containing protein n=1 Tax=Steccherinum ochraceum TaxID=92696 RepID=A0A4R0R8S4_9APHY|nr:hypothetical protein EIP91_006240 [Steccherinum ochraceum]
MLQRVHLMTMPTAAAFHNIMAEPVPPGSLVLLTGINGHVASAIALRLLERGYRVRGTVRVLSSARTVHDVLTKQFGTERLEIIAVGEDIAKEGVFDSAVKGVDAVIHTPSPVMLDSKHPEEQFKPAVNGTLNILRSAQQEPSVKRFLWFGSISAVCFTAKDPTKEVITRDDWNVVSEEVVKNPDDPELGFHAYIASKVVAERAAWKFMEEEQPSFSLTTVLGSWVTGPVFNEVPKPPRLDATLGMVHSVFAEPPRLTGISPYGGIIWCHLFDIADLFVNSLTSPLPLNKRLIGAAGRTSWVAVAEILRNVWPERHYPPAQEDAPTVRFPGGDKAEFDTALERELLGGKWRSLGDAVVSCARDLTEKEAKGWDKP